MRERINNGYDQMGLMKISIAISVSVLLFGCAQTGGKKTLFVNTKCDDPEIQEDIDFSVGQISDFLKANDVTVKEGLNGCGYALSGDQERSIEGALTDYELMVEIKSFFGL